MNTENAIEVKSLRKVFRIQNQTIPIIHIQDFSVKRGEQLAIYGSSGSGKTTLLNLIAGLIWPDTGEILIHGTSLFKLSESQRDQFRLETIGYIFQTYNLISAFSAVENIEVSFLGSRILKSHQQRIKVLELLEKVGLKERVHHKPYQLSSGEQQRVAIARALAIDPPILLADEPTANLDKENASNIMNLLKILCRETNKTLILVTHELDITQGMKILSMSEINQRTSLSQ